jgi:hypothetical protein
MEKLCSKLNANLAKLCCEMPELFKQVATDNMTSKEALNQARKISDKDFSKSAEDAIAGMCGALAYHLGQLTSSFTRW